MDSSPPAHVMATALSAKDIVFSYGAGSLRVEVPAFSPAPGVHHLVGLNGSGKSTFLKVLTGVLRPAEGQVLFHGAAITSADVFRRYCRGSGYLWQNFQLQGRTSTRRYLEYRAWLHGVDPTEARHVAQRALEAVDLLAAARTPVGALSGGMQRRIGIAAETLHGPQVLLLDEPSSGLDYRARDLLYDALDQLTAADATIITVAHEAAELARYGSTVHVMADGRLAASRTFRAGEVTAAVLRDLNEEAHQ